MSTPSPRKRLPVNPSVEHLRKQAKRRIRRDPSQDLSDAQHQIAREYGCRHWAELLHVVETMSRGADQWVDVKRTLEPLPAAARAGDLSLVRRILETEPFTQNDLDQALAHTVWYRKAGPWEMRRTQADLLMAHGADPDGQYGSGYGPIVFGCGECLDPDGMAYLIEHGADVAFGPIDTKYGPQTPLSHVLGTYIRGQNERKHRCIELLMSHGAQIPANLAPAMLAVHRGDIEGLDRLIDADPSLVRQCFPDMPFGNIALCGATLLHLAVDYHEIECVDRLLKRDADINARAELIDGVGGQTPVFHAIANGGDIDLPVLDHLLRRGGSTLDLNVRATFRHFGELVSPAVTPIEFAEQMCHPRVPHWRQSTAGHVQALERAMRRS